MSPLASRASSAGRAARTASPVPRGGDWIAVFAGAAARGDRLHPLADHDDRRGRDERPQRLGHMANHRPAGDLVQHLRDGRIDARALAGGKDDGGESWVAHDQALSERNAIMGEGLHDRRERPTHRLLRFMTRAAQG